MNELILPSSEECLKFIDELNREQWSAFDGTNIDKYVNDFHKNMTNICQLYSTFALQTPQINPFDFKLFRVRACDEIKNKGIRCEYSYPPIAFTKRNLRANLIGAPVFYASDHPTVALLEYLQQWEDSKKYAGKEYVISKWNIRSNQRLFLAPFIPTKLEEINEYAVLAKFTNEEFRQKTKSNITDDEIDGLRIMKEYFSNEFIRDSERTISSYLGHHFIYRFPFGYNILMYPSLKAKHGKINFALHPNFADEMLELSHVYRIRVNEIQDLDDSIMNFKYSLTDIAFKQGTKIKWTDIKSNEEYVKVLHKEDFGFELNTNN